MKTRLKKAEVFKPNKFHYALIEYLHNELTNNDIKNRKQTSYIKIDLPKKIEDRFDKIIIDCFNGKAYLRDEENKDRQLLHLNRFYGSRESDAMNCAESVCKQIKNYLLKLKEENNEMQTEIIASKYYIDMRNTKSNNYIDLRTSKKVIAENVINNRDYAIAIINGEIFVGDTHGEAITKYLKTIGINDISVYDRDELDHALGKGITNQFAAAHVIKNKIYIEPNTLENITLDETTNLLKNKYPDYEIINIVSDERLAKTTNISRLKKYANNDIYLVNGKVYENVKNIIKGDNIYQIAKAIKDKDKIYLEPTGYHVNRLDFISLGSILADNFPNCKIYLKDNYERLASLNKHFRKKLAWHDGSNRDYAMVYIDGETYEGDTHAQCINKYLADHYNLNLNDTQIRPNINIEVDDAWDDNQVQDLQNIYDNIKQMVFCHLDTNNKEIYVEPEGYNTSKDDITNICNEIKSQYSDYNIYIDGPDGMELKKVASQIGYHDKANRDSAILIIEGNVIEGFDHYTMINEYLLKNHNIDRSNPETEQDADSLFDSLPYAMGSKVDSEKTIYVDDICINDMDENEVIDILKRQYPGYEVIFEEEDDSAMATYNGMTEEEYKEMIKKQLEELHDKINLKGVKKMHRLKKIAEITQSENLGIESVRTWVIHHYNNELEKNKVAYNAFKQDNTTIEFVSEFDELANDLVNKLQTTDDKNTAEIMFDFKNKLFDWFKKYEKY